MKKIRYVVILLLASLALCGLCLYHTSEVCANTKSQIEEIRSMIIAGRKNHAKDKINALDEYWQKNQFLLSMVIHHNELSEIEKSIKLMQINIITNPEDDSDFWTNSTIALTETENLEKIEIPSLENIL